MTAYHDAVDDAHVTTRVTPLPVGRRQVQSEVKWPDRKRLTTLLPARLAPDLDDADVSSIARRRHERVCDGVRDGTIAPEVD